MSEVMVGNYRIVREIAEGGGKEHPRVLRYDGSDASHAELLIRLQRAYDRKPAAV